VTSFCSFGSAVVSSSNQSQRIVSIGGNPEGSGYKHIKYEKGQNMKPCVPFVRKHIGTVITFLAASCTMRDFPVPDEFMMHVCIE
jgi:hypothetical protein